MGVIALPMSGICLPGGIFDSGGYSTTINLSRIA